MKIILSLSSKFLAHPQMFLENSLLLVVGLPDDFIKSGSNVYFSVLPITY